MKLHKYDNIQSFIKETFEILLENEAQNNLLIADALGGKDVDISGWFVAAIKDNNGGILLTVISAPPYPILIYETKNIRNDKAVNLLINEIVGIDYKIKGVLAEQELSNRFAKTYQKITKNTFHKVLDMNLMICTDILKTPECSGKMRPLTEDDLFYVPYWEVEFSRECEIEGHDLTRQIQSCRNHIPKANHFIWEDKIPVSQAVNGRDTINGAVINGVYTPPLYRGRGYATSCVANLSRLLFEEGKKFCCLFADAENPISNGIYAKIGFKNACIQTELQLNEEIKC